MAGGEGEAAGAVCPLNQSFDAEVKKRLCRKKPWKLKMTIREAEKEKVKGR